MRKNKSLANIKDSNPDLYHHLQRLDLDSIVAYQDWCVEHGFSRKVNKSNKLRCRELAAVRQTIAEQRLKEKKHSKKNQLDMLKAICKREIRIFSDSPLQYYRLSRMLNSSRAPKFEKQPNSKVLLQMISSLKESNAKFFDDSSAICSLGCVPGNTYLEALALISAYHGNWIRNIESWKPRTHNVRRQFSSLLHHLFLRYEDLPPFFDELWFLPSSKDSALRRKWFIHVGKGNNIRTCNLPIRLTKKMAYHFMQAPKKMSFDHALHWGQMRGLGCDERLTHSLMSTRLVDSCDYFEFWESVIRWFSQHPMLDHVHLGPIIDYLHHQKFVPEQVLIRAGEREETPPAQPNLSMKGRAPERLLEQVENWHRNLANSRRYQVAQWDASGIPNYEWTEGSVEKGNFKQWTIQELLSTKALVAEGKQLKHCVASYSQSCQQCRTSIWTMELCSRALFGKMLTIEVRLPSRTICQIRGKYNRLASESEIRVIRRWASQAGLRFGKYVT